VKTRLANLVIPTALLVAGALYAGNVAPAKRSLGHYRVTALASLGGTASRGNSINNGQWIAGYSFLSGDAARHASLWLYGSLLDLGTLGGANSSVPWPVKNNTGLLSGIAQTATPDPLGESWSCGVFFTGPNATGNTCLGFAWKWGVMRALPTFGGNNGFATGSNDREEIVGWAENTVHDPTCVAPQVLQFRAAVWGPGKHQMRELAPLTGDSTSAATAINDAGQVAGISGSCDVAVGRHSARRAVRWEKNGKPTDLGDLGGDTFNTPMAIDQRGNVAGFAGTAGDEDGNVLQAFLWTPQGGMHALGLLPGDVSSEAHGMNNRGQMVGVSCTAAGSCRGFLWQGGQMVDLNTLVNAGDAGTITFAQDINDLGEITGRLVTPDGARLAFRATPAP
jgi:probable HAF family extracellular repeat protein